MAKIKLQGNASGSGVLTVTAPNTSTDRTITLPDEDVTLGAATPSIDDNGDATAITIDSNENVGIGHPLNTHTQKLVVKKNASATTPSSGAIVNLVNEQGAGNFASIRFTGTNQNAYLGYRDGTTSTDRRLSIGVGADSEHFSFTSNGLTFNGDTAAANALDDYETGVYQYTITGSTGGSMTPKSGYEYFSYTKIGRQVTVIGKFETSGSHNATGYLKWSLPFTVGNFTDQSESGAGTLFLYRTGLANVYNPTLVSSAGVSFFYSYYNTISNNEVNTLDGGNVDSTIEGFVHFTYFTD